MRYEGKTVLIAGGASGIGEALVKEFSRLEADVYSFDVSDPADAMDRVRYETVDVTDPDSIKQGLEKIKSPIDYLINSAGIRDEETPEGIRRMFNVNVNGSFYFFYLSRSRLSPDSTVVQISSGLALSLPKEVLGYASSKLASYHVARQFSELYGIKVKIALPGPVDTPLFRRGKSEEEIKNIRSVSPQYIAKKIMELIESDKAELVCLDDFGVWTHELR